MESDYIWDPLRKKSVKNTPEEAVRQWFIGVLHEGMGVPEHMMGSEVSLNHAGKQYRADIIVWDRNAQPLMIVECKRPEVTLDQAVVDQALRYNNGARTFFTSNFKLSTLSRGRNEKGELIGYGQYIGERIQEMTNIVEMPGESRREKWEEGKAL